MREPQRPLVLVTSIPRTIETTLPRRMANATVDQGFGRLIAQAGGIPLMSDAWTEPEELVARVDAVVINGGTDVDPARYGAPREHQTDEPDVSRDEFELGLIAAARCRKIPVLAVCRGMHLLNVQLGGTLTQDLGLERRGRHYVTDPVDRPVHGIAVAYNSLLSEVCASLCAEVNSVHHQAIDTLAPSLRVTARSEDGVVEAVEDADRQLVGVQWHPEFLRGEREAEQVALMEALLRGKHRHAVAAPSDQADVTRAYAQGWRA